MKSMMLTTMVVHVIAHHSRVIASSKDAPTGMSCKGVIEVEAGHLVATQVTKIVSARSETSLSRLKLSKSLATIGPIVS